MADKRRSRTIIFQAHNLDGVFDLLRLGERCLRVGWHRHPGNVQQGMSVACQYQLAEDVPA